MKVVIIGAGYVGLCTGITLAYLNNQVTFIDVDVKKIEKLNHGILPIYEPGLKELYELSKNNLHFRSDYETFSEADIAFITVGTPIRSDGFADMSYVKDATYHIGMNILDGHTIIINKSTVPIGSADWVKSLILDAYEKHNAREMPGKLSVVSNPEFLKEGTAVYDSFFPNRIVIGCDDLNVIHKIVNLYSPIINQNFVPPAFLKRPANLASVPLIKTNVISAELLKYTANSYLSLKISFINEIACLAEKVGADITTIAKGIGLDERIGSEFLKAGIGWGGSCFGKDTAAIIATASDYGIDMPIIKAAREVNYQMRDNILTKILDNLKIVKGKTIGILGLSFKPDTDDLRDAPSIDIIKKLVAMGAKVNVHDPVVEEESIRQKVDNHEFKYVNKIEEVFEKVDALILVTEWKIYRNIDWEKMRNRMTNKIVFDGRNFLDENLLESLDIKYVGVGK